MIKKSRKRKEQKRRLFFRDVIVSEVSFCSTFYLFSVLQTSIKWHYIFLCLQLTMQLCKELYRQCRPLSSGLHCKNLLMGYFFFDVPLPPWTQWIFKMLFWTSVFSLGFINSHRAITLPLSLLIPTSHHTPSPSKSASFTFISHTSRLGLQHYAASVKVLIILCAEACNSLLTHLPASILASVVLPKESFEIWEVIVKGSSSPSG